MLKKRIFVGLAISLAQILLFYGVYQSLFLFESFFSEEAKRTVFENLFLDWFFNDYVLVFALLIVLQNTLIIITWRKRWTFILRIITSILHALFWIQNMDALYSESLILGGTGILLIWLGPAFETILISALGIKHPYREREFYEDLDQKEK
ncbi:hypothetical protein MATR_02560 [Marivirga tractuosa]|uniref:Uncharacterized protein n=1 Tax=Marivirga tractuosa (strain ATCC 23168 / DSM 4126 / NBRC 15989 / NCIMB 1408 / VKM B-1430 / H-43) TaxID=643867 RepID=E4TV14_MARTH|nr:hypothetical protein [Marivirga tractuosa]ADR22107.1 hypothetical protein Ftrac_2125 [Marivirga tractuosa DSM 4126]BDD13431.1 hypothetical protein MATR_02560 [Marivirga tractuosa]